MIINLAYFSLSRLSTYNTVFAFVVIKRPAMQRQINTYTVGLSIFI